MSWWDNILPAIEGGTPGIPIAQKIAQNPTQFVQNAASGVGQTVKGMAGILPAIKNSIQAGTEPQDLSNFATGAINQYKNIAKDPAQAFYNNPVGTTLAVLPAGKLLGKVGDAGDAGAVAGAAKTGEPGAITNFGNKTLQGQYKGGIVNDSDINTLANQGYTKIGDVAKTAPRITGNSGDASAIVNDAIVRAKPINFGEVKDPTTGAIGRGGVIDTAKQLLSDNRTGALSGTQKTALLAEVNRNINSAMPADSDISAADPSKAFQFQKNMENGAQVSYKHAGTDPVSSAKAYFYNQMSKELEDRIFNEGGGDAALLDKNSPIYQAKINSLRSYNPILAGQIDNAKTIGEVRSLQAPWVRASIDAQQTAKAAAKAPNDLGDQASVGAALLGHPVVGAGMILSKTNMAKNLVGNAARSLGGNPIANSSAGLLPKIAGGIKTGVKYSPVLGAINSPNENNNGAQSNKNQITTPSSGANIPLSTSPVNTSYKTVNDLPTDMNNLKPDAKTGNYGIADVYNLKDNSGTPLALKGGDAKSLLNQAEDLKLKGGTLDGKTSHDAAYWRGQTGQEQITAAETKIKNAQELGNSINPTKYEQLESKAQDARAILKQAPPNLFQMYGSIDALRKATDPTYARLGVDLQKLAADYPGVSSIFGAKTSDVATAQLDQINKQFLGDYYTNIRNKLPSNTTGNNLSNYVSNNQVSGNTPLPVPGGSGEGVSSGLTPIPLPQSIPLP